MSVNILVVDDHPVTREGIRLAICARRDNCTVDICPNIAAARDHLRGKHRYDLILLDYRLPDTNGMSGLFTLRTVAAGIPIAFLTASSSDRLSAMAKAASAVGLLSKAAPLQIIADSIEALLEGSMVFPDDTPPDMALVELRERISSLSGAQLQVLVALLHGALNKQIAADLNLSEATIKAHMTAIFRKLGVNGRVEAVQSVRPLLSDDE